MRGERRVLIWSESLYDSELRSETAPEDDDEANHEEEVASAQRGRENARHRADKTLCSLQVEPLVCPRDMSARGTSSCVCAHAECACECAPTAAAKRSRASRASAKDTPQSLATLSISRTHPVEWERGGRMWSERASKHISCQRRRSSREGNRQSRRAYLP